MSDFTRIWVFLPLIGGIIWLVKTQGGLNQFWPSQAIAA